MRLRFRSWHLLCVVLGTASAGVRGAEVEGLRVWSGPVSTRVVLDLSAATPHRVFSLEAPHRIVIDLADTRVSLPTAIPAPRTPALAARCDVTIGFQLAGAERRTVSLQPQAEAGERALEALAKDPEVHSS